MIIRKFLLITLFVMLCAFGDATINSSHAAICFLPNGDCDGDTGFGSANDDIDLNTKKQCENEGFKLGTCNEAQIPTGVCPYDKAYILGCKCRTDLQTCTSVQDGVGTACDGKYLKCACKPEMRTCNSTQDGIGKSCDNKYASCECKNNLKTCTGLYVGVGESCGGEYNSCQCRSDLKTCANGEAGIGASCDGKFESCTCNSNLVSCTDVEDGVGSSCGGKFESCVCKKDLISCQEGQKGDGAPCGGKYVSCGCSDELVKCGELEDGVGASCGKNFESCKCKDSLVACTNNQIGVGKDCGGKFESCKCPDNWENCQFGAPSVALSCAQDGKTVYSTCSDKCSADFKNVECKKYEDVQTCANDSSMKICTPNCESKIAEGGYKLNKDVDGAVITKNITFSSSDGKNLKSVEEFRSKFPVECSTVKRPKPTLSYVMLGKSINLNNRTFNNLNLSVIGGKINFSYTSIFNGNLSTTSEIFIGDGHYPFIFTSDKEKATFKAGKIKVVHGADLRVTNANMTVTGLFVWNTSNVVIHNTTFRADYLETITSESRVEFSGKGTAVYVKNTFIGGIESYGGTPVYRRDAAIRVKDGANWYVSAGKVRIRDAALFCAGYGGLIWFSGGTFGAKYNNEYQGCRIYTNKDRTLSYGDWDPSNYTSWNGRGRC